jgi:CRP/FNR family transcriptional regulator
MRGQLMPSPIQIPRKNASAQNCYQFSVADNRSAREHDLATHETLFVEGDEAGFLFEVVSGVLCSYQILSDGRRLVLSFFYPGDIVGLVRSNVHHYSCEAACPARVRGIPKRALLRDAEQHADVGRRLFDVATRELGDMQDHQILLGRKSAIEKLATFLVNLARRTGNNLCEPYDVHVPMTRTDIADYLGMTIETVSRNLTKLRLMRAIELPHIDRVHVCRPDVLNQLANGPRCAD